jgi:type I restriction enzyme R subunit
VPLDKYADTGIENIGDFKVLQIAPFSEIETAPELVNAFGGRNAYLQAVRDLEEQLCERTG